MRRKNSYKVTYSGTRHTNKYTSKSEAVSQAQYAVSIGNMQSCIYRKLPSGRWNKLRCIRRRKAR